MTSGDDEVEYTLLNKRQAKAYQIPPATAASGQRAEDWKESIWIGRCRLVGKGTTLFIKLLDAESDRLFAQCVIPNGDHEQYVERTIDSSRYFVLKIANDQRHAFIGFGFSDRNDAFDFVSALGDFKSKFIERESEDAVQKISAPGKDLSLKQGETITVNLKAIAGTQRRGDDRQQNLSSGNASAPIPLLAPPPAVERNAAARPAQHVAEKETPARAGEFRPVPPRQADSAARARPLDSAEGFAASTGKSEHFAEFQSALGAISLQRGSEAAPIAANSTSHKSFVDYILPTFLVSACMTDPRAANTEFRT